MVPHGPGGQRLRPAPRVRYIPPSARARNRPRAGGRLFHPAPRLPSRHPSVRQRALATERGYKSQGQAVERTANRQRRAARQRVIRSRALAQERYYKSLGQAIERAATAGRCGDAGAVPAGRGPVSDRHGRAELPAQRCHLGL
jgi:hypothetical protein